LDVNKIIKGQQDHLLIKPKKPENLSNMDFLYDIMNFSPHGGMTQAFIMEAIRHYSNIVADCPLPEDYKEEEDTGMVTQKFWRDLGIYVRDRIHTQLKIKKD
jgi:hypothetical protein